MIQLYVHAMPGDGMRIFWMANLTAYDPEVNIATYNNYSCFHAEPLDSGTISFITLTTRKADNKFASRN